MSVGPVLVSAGRMINKHCDENKQRCCGQADRINHHQAGKTAVVREYGIYPCNPGSADTDGCKQCRDKRNPETPEIAGHDLIEQTENVCGKDNDQTGITDVNNLGITVKQGGRNFPLERIRMAAAAVVTRPSATHNSRTFLHRRICFAP